MSTIVFKDAVLVTMNAQREIIRGDLVIQDDRIIHIGSWERPADQVIDLAGQLVIPGLVQSHVHLCQTLFRGQADDLELLDWLKLRIWPLEAAHDEESLYWSARLGIGELLRGGTTSIIDMETVRYTDAALQAIVDGGIRALSGKCMMDHGAGVPAGLQETTAASLQQSVDLLEKWHGAANGRLQYAFNPRFVVSCTEDLLREVQKLSTGYQVRVHTHASENKGEIALVERERGMRNVTYLDHLGLANERLILAHCIWVDEVERSILQQRGVHVAHCPSCNLKLGSGIAPVHDMLAQGIAISLGADGAPCNNNLDQFTEMRTAALIQKPLHGPTSMPAWQVFELATLGGAAAMGLSDQIGSLEVGKKADLAVINLQRTLHTAPSLHQDMYAKLVYQVRAADVALTMVDGRILYRDGRLSTVDEETLIREAGEAFVRVSQRAGIF